MKPSHLVAIWGFPVVVTTWKSPQSPTVRLRSRVKAIVDDPSIYSLATAPNGHSPAVGFIGLKRTVVQGALPSGPPDDLTPEEEAMLEKLRKNFSAETVGWAPLDLSKDKVGFARHYLRTELA